MKWIAACFLLICATLARAQDPSAYLSRINVADESAPERSRALREGLMQVARYITGDERLMSTPQGQSVLARASKLTRSVGYGTGDAGQKQLLVDFDQRALDAALQQAGLPVFGVYAGQATELNLIVIGLTSARDYTRAVGHLRGQGVVKSLSVLRGARGRLDLRATVVGGSTGLAQALQSSSVLQRDAADHGLQAYRIRL